MQCFPCYEFLCATVDSERASLTGVTGARLLEANSINKSLMTLGAIINALSTKAKAKKESFLPFRNSILTWLLKDSLGGNCKTTIIANICSSDRSYNESLSSLKFVECAKLISTVVTPNDTIDKNARLRQLQQELTAIQESNANSNRIINGSSPGYADDDKEEIQVSLATSLDTNEEFTIYNPLISNDPTVADADKFNFQVLKRRHQELEQENVALLAKIDKLQVENNDCKEVR